MSFLDILSSGFKDLLGATLLLYLFMFKCHPSGIAKGNACGGCAYCMKNDASVNMVSPFFPSSTEESALHTKSFVVVVDENL